MPGQPTPPLAYVGPGVAQHPGQLARRPGRPGRFGPAARYGRWCRDRGQHGCRGGRCKFGRPGTRRRGGRDLFLARVDPGRHGRLRDEEGLGDLGRGQPTDRRRVSAPGLAGDRRVAAGEDGRSRCDGVTSAASGSGAAFAAGRVTSRGQLAAQGLVAPVVRRWPAGGRRREPGARVGRMPSRVQRVQGGTVRVLHALLGQVDVAGDARRRGGHEGPLATVRSATGTAEAVRSFDHDAGTSKDRRPGGAELARDCVDQAAVR